MTPIETERLNIRRLALEDAPFMLAMLTDPSFVANIGDRGVRDLAQAGDYLRSRVLASYVDHGFGMFRVALRATDEAVGICGLVRREGLDGPDLGFAYLTGRRRRGYGLEAAWAIIHWAEDELGIDRLLAVTTRENEASAKLLAKLGFREAGETSLPGSAVASRLFVRDRKDAVGQ